LIAVVLGSTGLVGAEVLKRLLADPEITQAVAVTRRPLPEAPKLRQVLLPRLDELPARAAELKGDAYFCCLGTTLRDAGSRENFRKVDHDAVVEFAAIAKSHRARSFTVVTAAGAAAGSKIFYNRVKGEVEAALQKTGLNRLVIFRPGLLVGDRKAFRPAERLAVMLFRALSGLLPAGWKERSATDVARLADRIVAEGKQTAFGSFVVNSADI
jgi:uncharacterized protein YbjT (DUF2867 family)